MNDKHPLLVVGGAIAALISIGSTLKLLREGDRAERESQELLRLTRQNNALLLSLAKRASR